MLMQLESRPYAFEPEWLDQQNTGEPESGPLRRLDQGDAH
jgi:hypothetical protein